MSDETREMTWPVIPVRTNLQPRVLGEPRSIPEGHWLFTAPCVACGYEFRPGEQYVLVVVGADNEEGVRKQRENRHHVASAVAIHAEHVGVNYLPPHLDPGANLD